MLSCVCFKELELNFNKLTEDNVQLRKEKDDLGAQLGARTAEKTALEAEMTKLKTDANNTVRVLNEKIVSERPAECDKMCHRAV